MKKKIVLWALALMIVFWPAASAAAAPGEQELINIKTVSGYCMDEELYIFCRLNENYDAESFEVSAASDQVSGVERDKKLTPIAESSSIVRYMFLVDRSVTMRKYMKEVNRFVEAIMEQEKQSAFYTVATFGERFDIAQADMTDPGTVKAVLGGLRYEEQWTDPYTGVMSALTYLDGCSVRSGDVIHLILITDGDPDLDADNRAREQELADKAAKRIQDTPEVIVSTFCTAEWDEKAGDVFGGGRGIHAQIKSESEAADAGVRMAACVDSLYRVCFRLAKSPQAERFQINLRFKGKNLEGNTERFEDILSNVPNLKMFSNVAQDEPEKTPGSEPEDTGEPDTEPDTEIPVREPDTEADGKSQESGSSSSGSSAGEPQENTGWFQEHQTLVIAVVGGAVLCALIVILICLLAGRKKRNRGGSPAAGGGIPVRLEVYAGRCSKAGTTMRLNGELLIGSSSECDLVFAEPEVSPRNSRIFMRDSVVYIEDLNSAEGTAICGMRIQGQNRLRSGDVISIGSVEFCLKF